jgi:hypothetical protein
VYSIVHTERWSKLPSGLLANDHWGAVIDESEWPDESLSVTHGPGSRRGCRQRLGPGPDRCRRRHSQLYLEAGISDSVPD